MQKPIARTFFLLVLLAASGIAWASPQYEFTDLGSFFGDTSANAINNGGQVTGWSNLSGEFARGFRWQNGVMTPLPPPFGLRSTGMAINFSGVVTGQWEPDPSQGILKAITWSGTTPTDLGGNGYGNGYGINDAGIVVGQSGGVAVYWTGTTQHTIPVPGTYSRANAINNNNMIVGATIDGLAFVYDGVTVTQLPTFGGFFGESTAVNDSGQVVGWAEEASRRVRAFLWHSGSSPTPLPFLGTHLTAQAFGINSNGLIVGEAADGYVGRDWPAIATLWENGVALDLNLLTLDLGPYHLATACDINDNGQIVGWTSRAGDGYLHAYLLTPIGVPEPSAGIIVMTILLAHSYKRPYRRFSPHIYFAS